MRQEYDFNTNSLYEFADDAPGKPSLRKKRDTKAQKKAKRKQQKVARRINRKRS